MNKRNPRTSCSWPLYTKYIFRTCQFDQSSTRGVNVFHFRWNKSQTRRIRVLQSNVVNRRSIYISVGKIHCFIWTADSTSTIDAIPLPSSPSRHQSRFSNLPIWFSIYITDLTPFASARISHKLDISELLRSNLVNGRNFYISVVRTISPSVLFLELGVFRFRLNKL